MPRKQRKQTSKRISKIEREWEKLGLSREEAIKKAFSTRYPDPKKTVKEPNV